VYRHELTTSLRFERAQTPAEAEQAAAKMLEVA
jgi:hypothetical protein